MGPIPCITWCWHCSHLIHSCLQFYYRLQKIKLECWSGLQWHNICTSLVIAGKRQDTQTISMVFSEAKYFTLKRQFRLKMANNSAKKIKWQLPQMSTAGWEVHVNRIMSRKDKATEVYINNDPIVQNGILVTICKYKLWLVGVISGTENGVLPTVHMGL